MVNFVSIILNWHFASRNWYLPYVAYDYGGSDICLEKRAVIFELYTTQLGFFRVWMFRCFIWRTLREKHQVLWLCLEDVLDMFSLLIPSFYAFSYRMSQVSTDRSHIRPVNKWIPDNFEKYLCVSMEMNSIIPSKKIKTFPGSGVGVWCALRIKAWCLYKS